MRSTPASRAPFETRTPLSAPDIAATMRWPASATTAYRRPEQIEEAGGAADA